MSIFLELCQDVARESRTVSGTCPVVVTNQSGRLLNIVNWTIKAWEDIQQSRNAWLWMRKEFTGMTSSGTARYTDASWNITDFARWITDPEAITLYDQSTGVSDEGTLRDITWAEWRRRYGRGVQTNNKPSEYAVSPQMEFCLGGIPDGVYVVNGEYYKTAQKLTDNADIPELPIRFHQVIVHRALMYLTESDENGVGYAAAKDHFTSMMRELERDQLPQISLGGGPLA